MCLGVTLAISVVFACLDYACIGQQRMDVLPVNIIELIWVCLLGITTHFVWHCATGSADVLCFHGAWWESFAG